MAIIKNKYLLIGYTKELPFFHLDKGMDIIDNNGSEIYRVLVEAKDRPHLILYESGDNMYLLKMTTSINYLQKNRFYEYENGKFIVCNEIICRPKNFGEINLNGSPVYKRKVIPFPKSLFLKVVNFMIDGGMVPRFMGNEIINSLMTTAVFENCQK